MSTLVVSDVSIAYDGPPVVEDISFTIGRGDFFGLMGLNGQGKTTLIKSILGLRTQQKGSIHLEQGAKGRLAYLPERFEPPWFFKGREFLKFTADLYGVSFNEESVLELAQGLALDREALDRRVESYSKGMRQKLGLVAVAIAEPDIIILDEPMSGLDPMARSLVKDMLVRWKKAGATLLMCSHILADMDEVCDHVGLLHDKKLQFLGTPAALKKETKAKNLERAFMAFIKA